MTDRLDKIDEFIEFVRQDAAKGMIDTESLIIGAWQDVIAQREEILRAFIAKYGYQPDEIVQVEQRTETGWRWYVQRKDASP